MVSVLQKTNELNFYVTRNKMLNSSDKKDFSLKNSENTSVKVSLQNKNKKLQNVKLVFNRKDNY